MIILNLGAGDNLIKGAINVDITPKEGIDEVIDLTKIPWKWEDESISKIYLIHSLEHFPQPKEILQECHRILKPGGIIEIIVPHSSSAMAVGCLGHYRTYSYDTLNDYLSRPFYLFKEKMFETQKQELRWWYGRKVVNVPFWMLCFIIPLNKLINLLAGISPQVCENLWCYWVGGMKEVVWIGKKV